MRIYEIETRKFSFMIVCEDSDEAFRTAFLKGWVAHCKEASILVDLEFFEQLTEDYAGNYIPAEMGCYRDMVKIA